MRFTSAKITNAALTLVCGAAALYAAVRWLLPWAAPFLLAGAAAMLLEPAVAFLCRRGLPRTLSAGACLLGALGTAAAMLWLLLRRLAIELNELLERAPEIARILSESLARWEAALKVCLSGTSEELARWAERALAGAEEILLRLPGTISQRALQLLPALAGTAPTALLFAVTAVIGAYFFSAAYPELLHFAARLLPERLLCRARILRR